MKNRIFTALRNLTVRLAVIAIAVAVLSTVPALAQQGTASTTPEQSVNCFNFAAIPVALAPGQADSVLVGGELCANPAELRTGATVQLLIAGATYNHQYWNFGKIDGTEYSYARDVAAHGFPTFALDEIGTGSSSHPASDEVTAQSAAYVAHQIVQGLRNGSVTGIQFGKVIIVGHSLGSTVVWQEAISYGDVDGVIITGAAHSVTTKFLNSNAFHPAVDDPKFANSGLDTGYLTTIPGTRSLLFYNFPDADPAVISSDEARKDVVSASELGTGIQLVTSKATLAIQVPVLTILGSNDFTTCGPNPQGGNFDCSSGGVVATQEVPFYSPQARIHGCVVPDSGHSLSLAVNHRLQAADSVAWSSAFVDRRNANESAAFNGTDRGLPWNDGLPWNCGAPATSE